MAETAMSRCSETVAAADPKSAAPAVSTINGLSDVRQFVQKVKISARRGG
jgi:hypothetical protein